MYLALRSVGIPTVILTVLWSLKGVPVFTNYVTWFHRRADNHGREISDLGWNVAEESLKERNSTTFVLYLSRQFKDWNMIVVNDLIQKYGKQGHPYAKAIVKDEIDDLVTALRRRFDLTEQESDFSPKSLHFLESKMVDLHQILAEGSIIYLEEDYVLLVREIAAYFIQVLMIHSGGEIDSRSPDLWNMQVIIAKPTTVVKGRERKTLP